MAGLLRLSKVIFPRRTTQQMQQKRFGIRVFDRDFNAQVLGDLSKIEKLKIDARYLRGFKVGGPHVIRACHDADVERLSGHKMA